MDGKQIKPFVDELSLAYNPANRKKFILMKEAEMQELVEILTSGEALTKEKEIDKVLDKMIKAKTLSEKAKKAVKGALMILNSHKDELPVGIMSSLAKAVSDYSAYVAPEETEEEKKKREEKTKKDLQAQVNKEKETEIYEKAKKDLAKEGGGDTETVTQLKKDVTDVKEKLEKAQEERRLLELEKEISAIGIPGDVKSRAKAVHILEKVSKEDAEAYVDQLKKDAEMMKAAGVFTEVGSAASGEMLGKAYDKLVAKVAELKKDNPKIAETEIWRRVAKENPELYKEYTKEHEDQGGR